MEVTKRMITTPERRELGGKRTSVALMTAMFAIGLLAWAEAGEEMWKARAQPTSYVPDWSKADEIDAAASAVFLKEVWPRLEKASAALDAKVKGAKFGQVYAGKMSEMEKAAGVVCFPLRVEQLLPFYAVPNEAQVAARAFSAFAARGQSEAVAVAVHALQDVKKVNVTCSDLKGPQTIPASAVTSRFSLSYTVEPRNRGTFETRQMVLLKVPSWDIPKARTYEWIVDVHVPQEAKAGEYKGSIDVTVDGKKAATFSLTLDVLPVVLSDNGCRWGPFMAPPPGRASEAWCELNARYGVNTLAWWKLDDPYLTWTWDGMKRTELILAKIRNKDNLAYPIRDRKQKAARAELGNMIKSFPPWLMKRQDGPFFVFKQEEVVDLPKDPEARKAHYKKVLKLKPELGELTDAQRAFIRFDRTGYTSNFSTKAYDSVAFNKTTEAFKTFDSGLKLLKKNGFVGPLTWFGAGGPASPWEIRLLSHRFGVKYSRANWKWTNKVTEENSNHTWYMANAAIAKTFHQTHKELGWPEIVWCPCDESFQYKGASKRSVPCMIGEMMPYIRTLVPEFRIYQVVWHKKGHKKYDWMCGRVQKTRTRADGSPSHTYGPFHVICTNCPNDLDRVTTWEAGGEYWMYRGYYATRPAFSITRFAMGLEGARHSTAVTYNYADKWKVHNLNLDGDLSRSEWIGGEAQANFYLTKSPANGKSSIDHAIASHGSLAARQGITDRKYVETFRRLAYEKKSAEDIAYIKEIGKHISSIGGKNAKGGVDNFSGSIEDVGGPQRLRAELAKRIKRLAK